jgi:uncharacterized membrane protein YqjE
MNSSSRSPSDDLSFKVMTVIKSALRLAGVRFSMATIELAEARDTFLRVVLLGMLALITLVFALLSLSGLIVVLAWETLGWRILMILFLAYLLLTLVVLWRARGVIATGKLGLPVTFAEMKKDRAVLFGEQGDPDYR